MCIGRLTNAPYIGPSNLLVSAELSAEAADKFLLNFYLSIYSLLNKNCVTNDPGHGESKGNNN